MQDVHRGWVEALRAAGVQVANFNLDDRLAFYAHARFETPDGDTRPAVTDDQAAQLAANGVFAAAYKMVPDVLLVTSGFFFPNEGLDLIRERGTKVVLVHTEEPYEHDRDLGRAAHADVNIVNDPTHLDAFRALGPAWYQPHCYRPDVHRPGPAAPEHRSDFAFVGTGYASRIEFLEAVDFTGVDVTLAGHWRATRSDSRLRDWLAHDVEECVDNVDAVSIYRGTSCSANLYRREANRPDLVAGAAMGPREVELAALGCFFLRDPRPESDEVLGMLPSFTDPGDFGDKLRFYLARPEIRSRLAIQARAAVSDRTFDNAARRLLAHLTGSG